MKALAPFQLLVLYANCADSPIKNKAKNALSLAETISPVLAGAKIGKIWIVQGKKKEIRVFKGSKSKQIESKSLFV